MEDSLQFQLFSQTRLRGYTNTQEHEENLALIASITYKMGVLEIILRNKEAKAKVESAITTRE